MWPATIPSVTPGETGCEFDQRAKSTGQLGQVAQIDSSRLHDGARDPMNGCEIGSKLTVHLMLYSIALSVRLIGSKPPVRLVATPEIMGGARDACVTASIKWSGPDPHPSPACRLPPPRRPAAGRSDEWTGETRDSRAAGRTRPPLKASAAWRNAARSLGGLLARILISAGIADREESAPRGTPFTGCWLRGSGQAAIPPGPEARGVLRLFRGQPEGFFASGELTAGSEKAAARARRRRRERRRAKAPKHSRSP
jgi:hypothetical protein